MNISELAARLQLSPSTVSRVLSGSAAKYRISPTTANRVREAAGRYGVAPDPLGASLRRGKLGMAGFLAPDITNPFFSALARSIELELRQHGITVQLCDSAENPMTELELLEQMRSRRLDGLILAPVGRASPALTQAIQSAGLPLLLIDRILPGLDVPTVSLDNAAAGRLAASHLIATGHRRIACLRGDHESHTDRERFHGVERTLFDADLPLRAEWIQGSGYSREAGLEGARKLFLARSRPDAVIALSGQGTLGLLEAAQEAGLRIPDDLSLVAFDEQPWSAFVAPPLTTVVQPVDAMAKLAARTLLLLMEGRAAEPDQGVFPARLHHRSSVMPRPAPASCGTTDVYGNSDGAPGI
ncbi:MAG: LacI family transcriptional regulator [Verrucomicrobia bacterium]|nr:LacI family transcriptional regulator [Verrucomicrobiota bacterium]